MPSFESLSDPNHEPSQEDIFTVVNLGGSKLAAMGSYVGTFALPLNLGFLSRSKGLYIYNPMKDPAIQGVGPEVLDVVHTYFDGSQDGKESQRGYYVERDTEKDILMFYAVDHLECSLGLDENDKPIRGWMLPEDMTAGTQEDLEKLNELIQQAVPAIHNS